jgi:hypothetical protein
VSAGRAAAPAGGASATTGAPASNASSVVIEPVWKPNIQLDFNVSVRDSFDATFSAVLRELDESNRFVQKSRESTSI